MAIVRYAGNRMTGVSGDTKPTAGSLITGTTFHETNTDDLYIWDGDSWNIVAGNTVAETLSSKTLTSPVFNTSLSGTAFLDEDNFASDSATKVASQQSIKAYVASQVSGTQNVFSTIAVSGQDNVVADVSTDTLTFAAGTNITLTTNATSDTVTIAASSSSATVTVTDNESTNENNLITFVANAATATGAHGLEMDGDLHYNPSTGTITSTTFVGALTGNVTGDASGTSATVTSATQAAITTAANLVTVGALDSGSITANFGSINVGSSTITTSGIVTAGGFTIGSAAITEAELEILDGALVTTSELNIIDGNTAATATTLADADRVIVNDNGVMVQVALTDFETYFESALDTLSNVTTVGVLNTGSITSGFGAIDIGSSNITTTGTVSTGNLTVTGTTTTVNSTSMTVVDPIIHLQTASGGGNLTSDTNKDVGLAMEYHNGSVAKEAFLGWDDSTGKLTFIPDATITSEVVSGSIGTIVANLEGDVTGDVTGSAGSATGNAATATALANARTIGGTSFDGTANIVPGTSTALATGRTISASGDITWTSASFDGSANVTSAAAITADVIVNADINTGAAIVDTKLATIATANKVGLAALDIDGGTEIGAAIVDADLFIIDDGAGGTNRKTLASRLKTYIGTLGDVNEYSFKTISVSGQTDVVADTTTDTLTLVAGSNVTLTTTADQITFATAGASESFAIAMAVAL